MQRGKNSTYGCDSTIKFILLTCARDSQEEHDHPRNPDLGPHFQVNGANTRVESGAHEHIVDEVTRHAHLFTTCDGPKVCPKRYRETPDHGNRHDVPVVVYDFGEAEYVIVVKDRGGDEGEVDGVERVAFVHESLVSQRWDRQAFLHITWHDPCKKELVENETGIHLPRVKVRAGVLREGRWVRRLCFTPRGQRRRTDITNVGPHLVDKRFNSRNGSREDEFAIIEPETYPQVVHEHRKSDHHGGDPPWSTKLPPHERLEMSWKKRELRTIPVTHLV